MAILYSCYFWILWVGAVNAIKSCRMQRKDCYLKMGGKISFFFSKILKGFQVSGLVSLNVS